MESQQHLVFFGNVGPAVEALLSAAASKDSMWVRRTDLEQSPVVRMMNSQAHCFVSSKIPSPAILWLHERSRGQDKEWGVGTVGPFSPKTRNFSNLQCNEAVLAFHAWAAPIVAPFGTETALSGGQQGPHDWMASEIADDLEAAVITKSPPSNDMELDRWHRFLLRTHEAEEQPPRMSPNHLRQWLIEDQTWEAEDADYMAHLFEQSLLLLDGVDRLRAKKKQKR